jgi:elongation factor 1 alpha-like protein
LKSFLKQAGYKDSDVTYVPCSGMTGDNLVSPIAHTWYNGPTLTDCIDTFRPPKRSIEKPFRCCVSDIFKSQSGGANVAGRIESGCIQIGESVMILPANELGSVKGICVNEDTCQWGAVGDQIILTLNGVDHSKITIGSVICSPEYPISVTNLIRARIIIFNIDIPITVGFPILFHFQSLNEPGVIKKLINQLNKSSGEVIKKKPR